MYLFKFSYIELIFHSVPTSTKKSLALVSTELKARNKSGTSKTYDKHAIIIIIASDSI